MVKDIKRILSAESKLNACILDALHEANIEIVSPNFMNQRQVGDTVFIPAKPKKHEEIKESSAPESIIFDKAEEAESIEKRKDNLADVELKLKNSQEELKQASTDEEKEKINQRIEKWTKIKEKMIEKIDGKIDEMNTKT